MISCRQAHHLFDAFLDGELAPSMRAELHAHRLACPDCSRELAVLEACADVVRTDRREPVLHSDFTDRVMVAFNHRRAAPVYRWRRIAVFAGAPLAAAAVLVFAVTIAMRPELQITNTVVTNPPAAPSAVASLEERLPNVVIDELHPDAVGKMTLAERSEFEGTRELPAAAVLEAWLGPVVERTNSTWTKTRHSASQLANFVSFGIAPEDILIAGYDEAAQTSNEKASDVNPDRFKIETRSKPQWIDSVAPDVDHPSLPEATDVVENEIEVM